MKKNIRNILSVFILLISYMFLFKSIYAKDIKIHATVSDEGTQQGVVFQTFLETYTGDRDNWSGLTEFDLSQLTYYYEDKHFDFPNFFGGEYADSDEWNTNTVRTFSYIIHNKPLTVYDAGGSGRLDYGYVTNYSSSDNKYSVISANQSSPVNTIEFKRLTNGYEIVKTDGRYITFNNNFFPKSYIDKIISDVDKYKTVSDESSNYCFYISSPVAWNYNSNRYCEAREIYDETGNKSTKYVGLKTAYECTEKDKERGWLPEIFGLAGKGWREGYDGGQPLGSFLNEYDNLLYIPKSVATPRKVYIRHVDKATGKLLKDTDNNFIYNDSAVLVSGDSESIINRSTYSSKNDHSSEFPEYYEIGTTDKLKVSRLLTLVHNGTMYKFDGVTKATAGTYTDAFNKSKNAVLSSDQTVTVDQSNSTDVTVITFEYTKATTEPPGGDGPKGGIVTLDSKEEINNCQMSYTPTGEDIKPYLIANKFKLKDLKYNLVQNGNSVKYNLEIFNVNKLVSGSIDNNTDNEPDRGRIFGGKDDKWTLIQGAGPQELLVNNTNIELPLNNFKTRYNTKLPTQEELDNFVKSNNNKTKKEDFSSTFKIPVNRYNGLRIPKLSANYQEYDVLNTTLKDNYVTEDDKSNTSKILVYNPISIEAPTVTSSGVVDHSTTTHNSVIQKNADFELTLKLSDNKTYVNRYDSDYLVKYYLIFDIDIIRTADTLYDNLYRVSGDRLVDYDVNVGDSIPRGTLIELSKDKTSFKAKAGSDNAGSDTVGDAILQSETNITLIGVSNNMPGELLRNVVLKTESTNTINRIDTKTYISLNNNSQFTKDTVSYDVKKNYCDSDIDFTKYKVHENEYYGGQNMYGDAYYFAKAVKKATNIGRIYDFKVTDCSDIDYKSVFRKTSENNVNELTKIQYFSGIKELMIYTNEVNTLEERDDISIPGSGAKTIIPLGPYKSTITSYVTAPKLGYRISFDLKTSGVYNASSTSPTREINIKPSYYYISKDGTKFEENITLYYKNSSGKYIKFEGSDYTIYFKPNDGYRSLANSVTAPKTNQMSNQLEPLVIGSSTGFTLNSKMMSYADNNFIQAWYGEFKLPNSTIATTGRISDQLTDGYIGVKFEIECIDNKGKNDEKKISYNTENKNDKYENGDPKPNTTQWDYEGFLGFRNPGSNAESLTLQLEKGTWNIDNEVYNKIKGSVVLFDTDNRAANDFD